MYYISHRGNLEKKDTQRENTITAIMECLDFGLNVEIDVWFKNNIFYLGHDEPIQDMPQSLLKNNRIWFHAKNYDALFELKKQNVKNYFWHNIDDFTITSNGYIWTYPGKQLSNYSIAVLPENTTYTGNDLLNCAGICSDQILRYINAKNN